MGYSCKNYNDQGGDRTVIRGELSLSPDARLSRQGTDRAWLRHLPNSTATTVAGLKTDHNLLLAKLREAGIIEALPPEITIIEQPEDAEIGASVVLSVAAVVSDTDLLSYQWYQNETDSNEGGSAITGATNPTYAVPADLAATAHFYCVITAGNTGVSAVSDPCTVHVPAFAFATVSKSGGGSVKITYFEAGIEANEFSVNFTLDTSEDHEASAAFADGVLTIDLAVDSGAAVTLTAAALAALINETTAVAALFAAEVVASGNLDAPVRAVATLGTGEGGQGQATLTLHAAGAAGNKTGAIVIQDATQNGVLSAVYADGVLTITSAMADDVVTPVTVTALGVLIAAEFADTFAFASVADGALPAATANLAGGADKSFDFGGGA